jgi:hypothetical protein
MHYLLKNMLTIIHVDTGVGDLPRSIETGKLPIIGWILTKYVKKYLQIYD